MGRKDSGQKRGRCTEVQCTEDVIVMLDWVSKGEYSPRGKEGQEPGGQSASSKLFLTPEECQDTLIRRLQGHKVFGSHQTSTLPIVCSLKTTQNYCKQSKGIMKNPEENSADLVILPCEGLVLRSPFSAVS